MPLAKKFPRGKTPARNKPTGSHVTVAKLTAEAEKQRAENQPLVGRGSSAPKKQPYTTDIARGKKQRKND